MSAISAADVNKLRKSTGAGMMDCKKALVEAEVILTKQSKSLEKKDKKLQPTEQTASLLKVLQLLL